MYSLRKLVHFLGRRDVTWLEHKVKAELPIILLAKSKRLGSL